MWHVVLSSVVKAKYKCALRFNLCCTCACSHQMMGQGMRLALKVKQRVVTSLMRRGNHRYHCLPRWWLRAGAWHGPLLQQCCCSKPAGHPSGLPSRGTSGRNLIRVIPRVRADPWSGVGYGRVAWVPRTATGAGTARRALARSWSIRGRAGPRVCVRAARRALARGRRVWGRAGPRVCVGAARARGVQRPAAGAGAPRDAADGAREACAGRAAYHGHRVRLPLGCACALPSASVAMCDWCHSSAAAICRA